MKKVLFVVPHFDDELLVGGSLLYDFAHSKEWETYVLYYTNGDYYHYEAAVRQKEAISSCEILGVDKNHIIYMGYGDRWKGEKHIYNSDDEIMVSFSGHDQTYSLNGIDEYCFYKHGKHNDYRISNIYKDLKDILTDLFPEVIVCVDYDAHPDHKALSLMMDGVLPKIITQNNYTPLYLKKYAYECVFRGLDDYYIYPHRPTICLTQDLVSSPIYKWNDRVRFSVNDRCNTPLIKDNVLFQAACKHKTQLFKYVSRKAFNSDIVYWRKHTENLAYFAEISGTSGIKEYINDGITIDSPDITNPVVALDASTWIPDKSDSQKLISLQWKDPVSVKQITIFENPTENNNIYKIKILFNNRKAYYFSDIHHDGSSSCFNCDEKEILRIDITIEEFEGERAGLSEIEVFDMVTPLSKYNLPVGLYKDKESPKISVWIKMASKIEKLIFLFDQLLFEKLIPSPYQLRKRFPEMNKDKNYLKYYCKNIIKRVENYKKRREKKRNEVSIYL